MSLAFLMFGGAAVSGGMEMVKQKKDVCEQSQKLEENMTKLIEGTQALLKAYSMQNQELQKEMFNLQTQITKDTSQLREKKADFAQTIQTMQYVSIGVFFLVAVMLFLKHKHALTINPLSVPP